MSVLVTLIWKANLLAKRLAVFQLIFTLRGVAVSLYLLIRIEMGWESRIYGVGAVAIIQALLLLTIALRLGWIRFKFDIKKPINGEIESITRQLKSLKTKFNMEVSRYEKKQNKLKNREKINIDQQVINVGEILDLKSSDFSIYSYFKKFDNVDSDGYFLIQGNFNNKIPYYCKSILLKINN